MSWRSIVGTIFNQMRPFVFLLNFSRRKRYKHVPKSRNVWCVVNGKRLCSFSRAVTWWPVGSVGGLMKKCVECRVAIDLKISYDACCGSSGNSYCFIESLKIECMIEWWFDRLIDWSFDWSIDWSIDPFDWSLYWSWLICWSIDWLIDWLIVRLIGWLVD